ncbi:MAG: hypothetical protein QM783_20265 [Phycisphaerales bacterium]
MATISIPKNEFLHGRWTPEESSKLYGVNDWGKGYFAVNQYGNLAVTPTKRPNTPSTCSR